MMEKPNIKIEINSHTDSRDSDEYNMDLSERRAQSVVNELTGNYGINSTRLTPKGVGPLAPVTTNKTDDGRKKNRRVELVEK